MAIKGLSMDSTVEYVSDLDPAKGTEREAEDATFFILGPLSGRAYSMVKDSATGYRTDPDSEIGEVKAEFKPNEVAYLTTQFGLRGFRNFMGDGGNEIPFKTANKQLGGQPFVVASPESMDVLGLELIRELSGVVEELSKPSEVELKD